MRLRMTLQTKFMISVSAMLILLVTLILFFVEKREVKAIFEGQVNKGITLARYIAYLNLQPFKMWDEEGVEANIEEQLQIDKELVYVVFYNRYNTLFAGSSFIKDHEEAFRYSSFGENVDEMSYLYVRKRIKDKAAGEALRILEVEAPIFAEGSRWGSIKIGLSLEDVRKEMQKTRLMLLLIGLGGILIGGSGATLLARRITGPLKKLLEGTVKIAKEDFSQQIDISSQDEIGNLAQSFNEMTLKLLQARERMETAHKRLLQAEKLASIGRISAGIAHEIRNPLTSVKLNIQKLERSENMDEVEKEHLSLAQEGIKHMEKAIKDLLDFTRVSELHRSRFSIVQIMEESIKTLSDYLNLKKVSLKMHYEDHLPEVFVDGDKLRQVFLNILRNAYEAVDEGGEIGVSLSRLKEKSGDKVRVEISDNGCGIPEEEKDLIFEIFYTTKASGIGLGLAIAKKIIEQHSGTIRVKNNQRKGICFEISIPCEVGK